MLHHYKVVGFIPLTFLAALDWGDWIYGFAAAIIAGGASSIASAASLFIIAPDNFNMAHPALVMKAMGTMFIVNGAIAGFSFLRNKPVPVPVTQTTHTETMVKQPGQPPISITSSETKLVEPVIPNKDAKET